MSEKSEFIDISSIFKSENNSEFTTPTKQEEEYNMSLIYDLLDMIVHKQVNFKFFFFKKTYNFFLKKNSLIFF